MVSEKQHIDATAAALGELMHYIVETHHGYLRDALPRIADLLERAPGAAGPVFSTMRAELELHMRKEETVLFPFIERMERAIRQGEAPPAPPFGSVQNPIRMMEREHDSATDALAQMRTMTADFTAPPEAGETQRALYAELAAMERDLLAHIHLENDILFPRAIAMER